LRERGRVRALTTLAMLSLSAGLAQAGSLTVASGQGGEIFDIGLNRLIASHRAESASYFSGVDTTSSSREQWYNPIADRNGLYGPADMTTAETMWSKANLRVYDLYEALGGNAIDLRQVYRHQSGRFYVALDTVGGQWFATAEDARGYMLKLLIQRSIELPQGVRSAMAQLAANDLESVTGAARTSLASARAFLVRGSSTAATLTGTGFSDADGAPSVQGPPGVTVRNVVFDSGSQLRFTIDVEPTARLGAGRLAVFNGGTAMVPVDHAEIHVVDGGTGFAGQGGGSGPIALPLAVPTASAIATKGEERTFNLVLPTAGTLTVASVGGTDVSAQLLRADGTLEASNDDGGNWYNFRIQRTLSAGNYSLKVRHCCQGVGEFTLTATLQ